MDLRSSRSRSRTPFVGDSFIEQEIQQELLEKASTSSTTVTRVTRRQAAKTQESSTSHEEIVVRPAVKRTRTRAKKVQVTSDYSSEDGDLELIGNRTITENERNQILEDARALANGSGDISALDLYRKSERYWEKYPKTDYTYSYHSKDRFEIAPGEVIMPNMSRRAIHDHLDESAATNLQQYHNLYRTEDLHRRKLFNNNETLNYSSSTSFTKTVWYRVRTIFRQIITMLVSVFYAFGNAQTGLFAKLHRISSWTMLLDTYLMRKHQAWTKRNKLLLLCLLPLLLFAAWWFLSSQSALPQEVPEVPRAPIARTAANQKPIEVSPERIAASLTQDQLDTIAKSMHLQPDTEELISKLLSTPAFLSLVQNVNKQPDSDSEHKQSDEGVNNLKEEIRQLKLLLEDKNRQCMQESDKIHQLLNRQDAKFTYQWRRCCGKKDIINVDYYLKKALNNPEFLNNQLGLIGWLQAFFVAKDMLDDKLKNATQHLDDKLETLVLENSKILMDQLAVKLQKKSTETVNVGHFSNDEISRIVRQTLNIYDADKTGLVDYAMEPMGGQIVSTRCTETYHSGKAVVSVLGIPLWYPVNTPRTVITPGVNPGECWAFENFPGLLVIKLSDRVKIEAFTVEHVNRLLVPNGRIDSAPKDFEVYGLESETDRDPIFLGRYQYDYDGEAVQTFAVKNEGLVFDHIELRIMSNHGNPNYSCLYRFRVHGQVAR